MGQELPDRAGCFARAGKEHEVDSRAHVGQEAVLQKELQVWPLKESLPCPANPVATLRLTTC